MIQFESLLVVMLIAIALAAIARRVGAPYPAFLALGGAVLAFIPAAPTLTLEPDLALAIFVAPVLLDAAYDSSPRDLRRNWVPLTLLVIGAVVVTTVAVAAVARLLIPALPWSAAVALGAIVAPPDAAAATAVLRQVKVPHRVLVILEGESLLNDATALLIYRLAVGTALANGFDAGQVAPAFFGAFVGSLIAGPLLARLFLMVRVSDIPTAVLTQFLGTFGIWVLAERLGLSPVLTTVAFAMTAARQGPRLTPARMRLPSYAVWETTVFVLNVGAFVFIGLQIRPILGALDPGVRNTYLVVAAAIFATIVVVRVAWVMVCTVGMRRFSRRKPGAQPPPRLSGGLIVSWCGMRGIVTLAAALALPLHGESAFPFRDLILVVAFSVVLGTLVVQGLTLKPLVRALGLEDGDPVGQEVAVARRRALSAAEQAIAGIASDHAAAVRHELASNFGQDPAGDGPGHAEIRRDALAAARRTVLDLRDNGDIGDDAFHVVEEQLDHLEISDEDAKGQGD